MASDSIRESRGRPDESEVSEYRVFAPAYDLLLDPVLAPLRRTVAMRAGAAAGRRAVDICCGTGRQLTLLHGAGFVCAGVDLSTPMLRIARHRCPPDVDLRHEDASRMSFADGSFDVAVLSLALHDKDLGKRADILAEALRVITPGGLLLAVDYVLPDTMRSRLGLAVSGMAEMLAGPGHHSRYHEFLVSGGLINFLSRRGLVPLGLDRFLLGALGLVRCGRP